MRCYFLILICFVINSQLTFADDLVPLKIVLNTQDKGEYFVIIKSNNDVLITEEDFKTLGIKVHNVSVDVEGVNYISLTDLTDQLEFKVNEKDLTLDISINPASLEKTVLDLSQKTVIRSNPFGIDSAFLNYSVINQGSNKQWLQSVQTPLEGVISANDLLLQLNFNYRRDYIDGIVTSANWSRGITNITKDYPQKLSRLIVGDMAAVSGELGGSGIFFGLSYRKKFSLATYFTKYPSIAINGVLQTPSRVNMYVNGVLVRSESLPPGEFTINNLPNLYGAGNLEMETIDAFGRITKRSIPFYVSTKLLRVGLNDFMYSVGFKRVTPLDAPQARYQPTPVLLGFHRYGFARFITAGYRFEFSDQLKNIGASASILLGSLGEAESGLSISENNSLTGTARFFRYGFTSQYFHGRYSYNQRTINYRTVSNITNDSDASQSVGFGVHGLVVGSLAFGYKFKGRFSSPKKKTYSLIYSVRIAKQASLLARATRTEDLNGSSVDAFVVSISAALGRKVSASASYADTDGDINTSAYVQKALPIGTGFGGRLRLDRLESDDGREPTVMTDASLKIKTKILSVSGDYSVRDPENEFLTQVAGSLAFIDNDFFLTRPIRDSFGLAKVDDLDNVRVYYSNELVGKTNNGLLIIPNLVSYADNYISIDGQDIPVDRALKTINQRLSPKFRTGSVALFEVDKFQGFFGYISLEKKNVRKTADYAKLTLEKSGQVTDMVVGKGGEFYVENLASGNYRANVKLDGEVCRFEIKIPKSKEMMVELGHYVCQM